MFLNNSRLATLET